MARIDFYVLPQSTQEARLHFAIKLCQKALNHHLKTVIWLDDHAQSAALDTLLWQTQPESFLPHALLPASEPLPPLLLCSNQDIPTDRQYLINLSSQAPPNIQLFERTAEIVIQASPVLENTRDRYRQYKQANHALHMHNL